MVGDTKRTVAVIGGSGFIGQAIARRLAADGRDVDVLDPVAPAAGPGIGYVPFDMCDPRTVAFWETRYHAVIIAAGVLAKGCNEDPEHAWKINVTATLDLLGLLAETSPRTRIVFLSSGMVYDGRAARPPFDESAATAGVCAYTRSKLRVEQALMQEQAGTRLPALVLRPFTVFGEEALSHDRGHLFGRWLELGRQGRDLTLYGDGSQVIDPVHVDRVSAACLAYLRLEDPGHTEIVNVTSGGPVSLRRLAELFVEAGLAPGIEMLPSIAGDTSRGWGDASRYESLVNSIISRSPEETVASFLQGLGSGRSCAS